MAEYRETLNKDLANSIVLMVISMAETHEMASALFDMRSALRKMAESIAEASREIICSGSLEMVRRRILMHQ